MKRPSFQFYPGDWRRDTPLQSCSIGARGLWIEMMCLMHDGTPYGHLRVHAKDILPPILARMVGVSLPELEGYLEELCDAGVLARTESGTIYSKRMVRDEEIRQSRASGGFRSLDNPHVPRPKDTHKGYPSPPSSVPSFDPSPAVAVASASAREEHPPTPLGAVAPVAASTNGNGNGKHLALRGRGAPPVSRTLPAVLSGLTDFLAEVTQQTEREFHRDRLRDVMVDLVFAYWAKKTRHDGAKLDRKRAQGVRKRLIESDDNVHQLLFAVDGALKDDMLMGRKADSSRKYDGISTIYRDWEQVERLAAQGGYVDGLSHPMAVKYLDGVLPTAGATHGPVAAGN